MIKNILVVCALSTLLLGCGGGGGGGGSSGSPAPNTPPASSSSSSVAVSSSSSSVASSIALAKITLSGALTNTRLKLAEVTVNVGDQQFTTQANADSNYNIELQLNAKNEQQPIKIVAKGVGANSWIEFSGLLPSITYLSPLAGEDKVLNSAEYFGVNISTLSTAEYALMVGLNEKITNDAERQSALTKISLSDAVNKAAMIQSFSGRNASPLPSGTASTLTLLLNTDLADAQLALETEYNGSSIHDGLAEIRHDPHQTQALTKPLQGRYFFELADKSIMVLDFNANGTGNLSAASNFMGGYFDLSPNIEANFHWTQLDDVIQLTVGDLSLDKTDLYLSGGQVCDTPATDFVDVCQIRPLTFTLEALANREQGKLIGFYFYGKIFRNGNQIIEELPLTYRTGMLIDGASLPLITPEMVAGAEWHTGQYIYKFSADGSVTRKNMTSNFQEVLTWKIVSGHLEIGSGTAQIWAKNQNAAGFTSIQLERPNQNDSKNITGQWVKRQNITMDKTDWVGRWTSHPLTTSTIRMDIFNDNTWRDSFGAVRTGNWSVLNQTTATFHVFGTWTESYDLLAKAGNTSYFHECHWAAENTFYGCSIVAFDRSDDFTKNVFWASWMQTAFNEAGNDKAWVFYDDKMYVTEAGSTTSMNYKRVSANRLFVAETSSFFETIKSSPSEVWICEYKVDKSCEDGVVHKLQLGVDVNIATPDGRTLFTRKIQSDLRMLNFNSIQLPRGVAQVLELPSGAFVASVTGCGGTLIGLEYHLPPLSNSCDISVTYPSK